MSEPTPEEKLVTLTATNRALARQLREAQTVLRKRKRAADEEATLAQLRALYPRSRIWRRVR
jgi:hypothetical protein